MVTVTTDRNEWFRGSLTQLGRQLGRSATLALIVLGLALAAGFGTYAVLSGSGPIQPTPTTIQVLLIVDTALVLMLAAIIAWHLVRLWSARQSGAAGARLHTRLVTWFSLIAVTPAIVVAVFGFLSLNIGMESWFGERVREAVESSRAVSQGSFESSTREIRTICLNIANTLNRSMAGTFYEFDEQTFLSDLGGMGRVAGLHAAIVYDNSGRELLSWNGVGFFGTSTPTQDEFERARSGEGPAFIPDEANDQIRALYPVKGVVARFVLVVRYVSTDLLENVRRARLAASQYQWLEENRLNFQILFFQLYAAVALAILSSAIWLGIWAANRLVAPIGRLIGAAERVSEGDLGARVQIDRSDDEVGTLARVFNRMTSQLETQRGELIEANKQFDSRRRFTEAVLSGVSAGVVGLDALGQVNIVNRSALVLLGLSRDAIVGRGLIDTVPEMAPLLRNAFANPNNRFQGQIDIQRDGQTKHLNIRVTSDVSENERRGYVVTFDDITELVAAQRTSAWADVARRIAHEIKNPLTPIQLSAERLRRKYGKEIQTDPEVFEQCTQTIIRQVSDIGRMVDEFSSFARTPEPVMRPEDVSEVVRQVAFLQRVANQHIVYDIVLPEETVTLNCDGRLVSQALINVMKNAAEAVNARYGVPEGGNEGRGRIEISLALENEKAVVAVIDNGVGLPHEDRNRLTEPYVTTRSKGTGLGLAIVRKIMEDHGGEIVLEDAPATDRTGSERGGGAMVKLIFVIVTTDPLGTKDDVKERATQSA